MPGSDRDDGPLGQHRGHVVRVDVIDVPVSLEVVDVAQELPATIRENRFHRHRLAARSRRIERS